MKWWGWMLSLLPVGVGILIAFLATNEVINNPILFLRGKFAPIAILIGGTLSIITIAATQFWIYNQNKHRREVQVLRKQASEDRRRFLQRLDHELKNPLTVIQAGLTNMTYEPLEDYLANEVSAVQVQVLRITRLVADLRKLAALEVTPLETTVVNMAELLTEVVDVVKDQANLEDRQIALILPNAPWPLPDVEGDPDLLLLAIHNLLDNAVKFTSPGDTIEVRAFDDGNDIVIEVADTGPGIPEIEIDRVWEELYRGEQVRSVPGTGLGLPLVQAIIEKHGGIVGLRSRPDQGTVFSVRLPAI
ncbi:MAG: ATP-binding protein [Anaerolineales bacterium]